MRLLVLVCLGALAATSFAQTQTPPPPESPAPAGTPAAIPPDSPKFGVYPIAYREIITAWLADRLLDPSTAQLEFGEPQAGEIKTKAGRTSGYSIEFRVNSRNKFGMYTGFQKFRVLIKNGEIIWSDRVRG